MMPGVGDFNASSFIVSWNRTGDEDGIQTLNRTTCPTEARRTTEMAKIAPPAPFNPAPFNPATEDWESFSDRFRMYLECTGMKDASGPMKRAVFLTHCGTEVFQMAKALTKPADATAMDWDVLEPILRRHYAPEVPILIRRNEFYRRDQRSGESFSDFVAELRRLGGLCEFDNLNNALRDRIVLGLGDPALQSRLMAKGDISLADTLTAAAAAEATRTSADSMRRPNTGDRSGNNNPARSTEPKTETTTHQGDFHSASGTSDDEEDIHRLQTGRDPRNQRGRKSRTNCAGCGGDHPRSECRFFDSICRHCDKKGHISRVCRLKKNHSPARWDQSDRRRESTPPRTRDRPSDSRWDRNGRSSRGGDNRRREETHQTVTIGHAITNDARKVHVEVI